MKKQKNDLVGLAALAADLAQGFPAGQALPGEQVGISGIRAQSHTAFFSFFWFALNWTIVSNCHMKVAFKMIGDLLRLQPEKNSLPVRGFIGDSIGSL